MAMDKGLYQAPTGLSELAGPPVEIEIEDPEAIRIGIGDMEIDLEPKKERGGEDFDANLAEYLDESELQSLANELSSDYDDDVSSRKDWMQTYVDGLELLGMKIEIGRAHV